MLFGLFLMGGIVTAVTTSAQAERSSGLSQQDKIDAGRELFLVGCSFCHGQNGEGVISEDGKTQLGPSLAGVGAAAVEFQVETGRMPAENPGKQFPRKKHVYSEEEINLLEAYVASLAPGPAVPEESDYSIEGLSGEQQREAVVRGGQLFLTNCTACHNFEGAGGAMPDGKYAPKLKGVESKHIYEAMLTGPQQMPVFSNGVMTPEDKRDIIAYLKSIEDKDQTPAYGGFGMGGFGPVAEGLFAWLVGIGACVGFAYWIAAHTARSVKEEGEA